jgi:hypothetical protein
MRRKVIVAVVIVVLAAIGYVGFLLSRDPRQHQLSEGSSAVIALSDSEQMILENSSSEDSIPFLKNGDQIKIVNDPVNDRLDRMRKVSVLVESGKCKGLTGTIARIWIRPTSWLRGRAEF